MRKTFHKTRLYHVTLLQWTNTGDRAPTTRTRCHKTRLSYV